MLAVTYGGGGPELYQFTHGGPAGLPSWNLRHIGRILHRGSQPPDTGPQLYEYEQQPSGGSCCWRPVDWPAPAWWTCFVLAVDGLVRGTRWEMRCGRRRMEAAVDWWVVHCRNRAAFLADPHPEQVARDMRRSRRGAVRRLGADLLCAARLVRQHFRTVWTDRRTVPLKDHARSSVVRVMREWSGIPYSLDGLDLDRLLRGRHGCRIMDLEFMMRDPPMPWIPPGEAVPPALEGASVTPFAEGNCSVLGYADNRYYAPLELAETWRLLVHDVTHLCRRIPVVLLSGSAAERSRWYDYADGTTTAAPVWWLVASAASVMQWAGETDGHHGGPCPDNLYHVCQAWSATHIQSAASGRWVVLDGVDALDLAVLHRLLDCLVHTTQPRLRGLILGVAGDPGTVWWTLWIRLLRRLVPPEHREAAHAWRAHLTGRRGLWYAEGPTMRAEVQVVRVPEGEDPVRWVVHRDHAHCWSTDDSLLLLSTASDRRSVTSSTSVVVDATTTTPLRDGTPLGPGSEVRCVQRIPGLRLGGLYRCVGPSKGRRQGMAFVAARGSGSDASDDGAPIVVPLARVAAAFGSPRVGLLRDHLGLHHPRHRSVVVVLRGGGGDPDVLWPQLQEMAARVTVVTTAGFRVPPPVDTAPAPAPTTTTHRNDDLWIQWVQYLLALTDASSSTTTSTSKE